MARLHDVPVVLRSVGLWGFARRVWNEIIDDNLFVFAGSLAYAWLFAIFPFFIFLLNLIPFLRLGEHQPFTVLEIEVFMKALLPDLAATTLLDSMRGPIETALNHRRGGVLSLSLLVALWAASGGITVTMAAFDKCYEIDKPRAYYKRRPMAFFLTAATAGLACVVVFLLPVGATFKAWVFRYTHWEVSYLLIWVFDIVRGALAIMAAFLFLSLLYHFGPTVKHKYRSVTPGAAFTLVCWVLVGVGFRAYVQHFGGKYHETYGPVGGVAVLLVLFYIDALVLMIGAEINSEIDFEVLKVPRGSQNLRRAEEGPCWRERARERRKARRQAREWANQRHPAETGAPAVLVTAPPAGGAPPSTVGQAAADKLASAADPR